MAVDPENPDGKFTLLCVWCGGDGEDGNYDEWLMSDEAGYGGVSIHHVCVPLAIQALVVDLKNRGGA